ncbi:MAG: SDR family oxidoreductase [Burkholderiales bacterium]
MVSSTKRRILPVRHAPAVLRPAAFRRPRLLIVGCGDVGLRVARAVAAHWRVRALSSSPERRDTLRTAGVKPIAGNLDEPRSLTRLRALAPWVMHLAPPPGHGATDPRTAALLAVLARGGALRRLVYASTSGVYGDAQGQRFDESRPTAPATDRARRRVDAEQRVRAWALASGSRSMILRVPGIYAIDRPGGHPGERIRRGTPVLATQDDVHTNHIHADDLACIALAALLRGSSQRIYHASDDTELLMGDYFDLAAELCGLPAPPRVTRAQAQQVMRPVQLSFMSESRRLINQRMKQELRVRLHYPTVREGLRGGS